MHQRAHRSIAASLAADCNFTQLSLFQILGEVMEPPFALALKTGEKQLLYPHP
jgi:hypothetical protein